MGFSFLACADAVTFLFVHGVTNEKEFLTKCLCALSSICSAAVLLEV